MENSFETNFIPQTVEKTPFADMPAQNFFIKWCEINDSIFPKFISREEWEQRGVQGILEKNNQGEQTLLLPTNLHLWEMMDVIKTVDHDTLARNPEKREDRANQIQELGSIFEKAGRYLSEYLPEFQEDDTTAKQIAQDIAKEFYQYGLSLQHKEKRTEDIPEQSLLTEEDKTKLDEWFLGKDTYQKMISRLGENPSEEQIEDRRKELLQVYFKALGRVGYKAEGEKPWETTVGPMQHLQDKTRRQITKSVETPEREMETAIFRRGVEKLVMEMKLEAKKLYDILQIDKLKEELNQIKENGTADEIAKKELEISKKIQYEVSRFRYKNLNHKPSEMVKTEAINCVGSTIIAGGILDELGIKHLNASVPNHAVIFLVTSDDKVYWQDFTPPSGNVSEKNKEILDGDIIADTLSEEKKKVSVQDIINLAKNPSTKQMSFLIKGFLNHKRIHINLSSTAEFQVLSNVGFEFKIKGDDKSLSILNPRNEKILEELKKEAIKNYLVAIEFFNSSIDRHPTNHAAVYGLGITLSHLGEILDNKKEKEKLFRESIKKLDEAIKLVGDSEYYGAKNNVVNDLARLQDK